MAPFLVFFWLAVVLNILVGIINKKRGYYAVCQSTRRREGLRVKNV